MRTVLKGPAARRVGTLAMLVAAMATSAAIDRAPGHAVTAPSPATAPTGMRLTQPLSAGESAKLFHVKAGYEIELVACEPQVQDPVAFAWGPDGRLWVVEMSDYPYGADGKMKAAGRVRCLQDSDGDGVYETSTLFAEGLNFPTGILPWRDGVIVTAAPDVRWLADTNGDGRADVNTVLYTGFTEGNPQLRVNCPQFGLDNWVYLANGLSSRGQVTSLKTGKTVDAAGHDFRIRPDTGDIEPETGASQFGRKRDDAGDWFGVHNSFPGRQFVIPDRYTRRNPLVSLPQLYDDLGFLANPKVYPLSQGQKRYGTAFFAQSGRFTSACGIMIDRDRLLAGVDASEPLVNLFTCEPVHNLIQHNVLTPRGSTFVAGRPSDEADGEFLASRDEWFRPVFCTNGPDGAMYVADMYRFMIEHPDWLPQEGKDDYRPYYRLGQDKGRIWRIKPAGKSLRSPPRLDSLASEELASAMDSTSGWQRDLVQAMLVWRHDPAAIPPLQKLAASANDPLVRMQSLCALDGLEAVRPADLVRAFTDNHPAVRRQAVRLAEQGLDKAGLAELVKLVDDPDPAVRLQLALSLGELAHPAAGAALVRLALRDDADVYLAAAVMTSAKPHVSALADAVLAAANPSPRLLGNLQAMAIGEGDAALLRRLIEPTSRQIANTTSAEAFAAVGDLLDLLADHKSAVGQLAAQDAELNQAVVDLTAKSFAAARVACQTPGPSRNAAISLLGRDSAHTDLDLPLLRQLFQSKEDDPARAAAARALGRLPLDDRQRVVELLTNWPEQPPAVRSAVLDVLLSREGSAVALLQQVRDDHVPATADFDAARRQQLSKHKSAEVRALASQVLGDPKAERAAVVAAFLPAVQKSTGDATRGHQVYQQNCVTCHRLGNEGVEIGPNLASVAGWPAEAIVTAVLDPSRSAEPRYLGYTATLADGEAVQGVLVRESPSGVVVRGLDGKDRDLPRQQIKSLECANRSFMPDGLEVTVDASHLADLIAFLRSQPASP